MISIMGVMALFGLTWVFGALTVREASTAFQFLFATFNSLQGFFIFLFFCVFGKEGRELWLHVLCCGRKIKSVTASKQQNEKLAKYTAPGRLLEANHISTGQTSSDPPPTNSNPAVQSASTSPQSSVFIDSETPQNIAKPMALQLETVDERHTIEPQVYPSAKKESTVSHLLTEQSQILTEVPNQDTPLPVRSTCRSTIRHGDHEQTAEIQFGDNEEQSNK